ncbi:MAG: hypothetical protein HQL26_09985 [Candidatus Omnitrophica bacterium]|nr:hypothetical protein [Candidatus Omnitrophota bacterium]
MNKLYSKNLILMSAFFFVGMTSLAFPMVDSPYDGESRITQSLLNHGAQQIKNGSIETAINDFSRILLINPMQTEAQDNLIRLSNENHITSFYKIRLVYFRDLITSINNLVKQISYFESKIDQISGTTRSADEIVNLHKKLAEPEYSKDISIDNRNFLEILNEMLRIQKEHLSIKLAGTTQKYALLIDQNKTLNIYQPQNIYNTETRMAPRQEPITSISQSGNNQKIIDLSLQLTEKDQQLNKKDERFTKLINELKDLQARFDLNQQLLEQKQISIDDLQEKLAKNSDQLNNKNDDTAAALLQREENLIEANGILAIYKDKFQESQNQIKFKERDVKKIEALTALKIRKYSQIVKNLEKEKTDFEQMKEYLEIYQHKFKDTYIRLKKKDADVKTLNEQLTIAQKTLFDREKAIKRAQANFDQLAEQLKSVQNELSQMKPDSDSQNENTGLDQEKTAFLKTKISILQSQIKNNLYDLKISTGVVAIK